MRNGPHILFTVAARTEHLRHTRQVGNGIQIHRRLLRAKPAVEVRAETGVPHAAGELADVIDVFDKFLQFQSRSLWRGLSMSPTKKSS